MKTNPLILLLSAVAFVLAVPSAQASEPVSSPSTANSDYFWISVRLPDSPKASWVSDVMAETFADVVAKALKTQGFEGKIGTLRPEVSAPDSASVLVIRLTTWTALEGKANCTFSASLRTRDGDRELGIFSGDNVVVTADGQHRFSSDGLTGSAQEALNDLYERVQATGLLKTGGHAQL